MNGDRTCRGVLAAILSGVILLAGGCGDPESPAGEAPVVRAPAAQAPGAQTTEAQSPLAEQPVSDVPVSGVSAPIEASLKRDRFPDHWWKPVPAADAAWWEILPQAAGPGEVVLSKRNELGVLSNFAATPFVFRGQKYASLEGLWQSLKYPESPDDPRALEADVVWNYSRGEVSAMVAFEAKQAGDEATDNMKALGIDWVTFDGERIRYRGADRGRYYRIIEAATRAKLKQNPEVEQVLLATGDLVLRPDHVREENAGAAWRYEEIWMKLRAEVRAQLSGGAEED